MRSAVTFVLVILALSPFALAEGPRGRFEEPVLVPELSIPFDGVRAGIEAALEQRSALVATGKSEPAFIFPIVGTVPGGGGTYFRTEATLVNLSDRAQNVAVYWFPVGGGSANCSRPGVTFAMAANTWYVWSDFVTSVFQTQGLGGAAVVAFDNFGEVDATAAIDGFARIWTPVPGFQGTASQSFSAESLNVKPGAQTAYGLRHDAGFRSNVGIFNYAASARTFDIQLTGVNSSAPMTLPIDACSLVLAAVPDRNYGAMELYITARDGGALWYGFGSSVDNLSGDNWSSVVRPK